MSTNTTYKVSSEEDRVRTVVEKAWSDPAFKAKLLADARSALRSLGIETPAGITIRVHENTPAELHYVLPPRPASDLNDMQLESVAGGIANTQVQGKKGGTVNTNTSTNTQINVATFEQKV